MSRTYHLSCEKAGLYLWIGQGRVGMDIFYNTPEHIARLHRFLNVTAGHSLRLTDSEFDNDALVEFEGEPDDD